jgi:hypothetical protein
MSLGILSTGKVLSTALKFIQKQYKNGEKLSPSEIAFGVEVQDIKQGSLLARVRWEEMLSKFVIGVVPINLGLPEHDKLESLIGVLNEKANPAYKGMFYPVFTQLDGQKTVYIVYEAQFPWSVLTPFEDFDDYAWACSKLVPAIQLMV